MKTFAVFLAFLGILACKRRVGESDVQGFDKLQFSDGQWVDTFTLARAEREVGLRKGIDYRALTYKATMPGLEADSVRISDVQFLHLTKQQFERLRVVYGGDGVTGGGLSRIKWDPERAQYKKNDDVHKGYRLSDFLPPLMQATLGTGFWPEMADGGDPHAIATVHINCWNTAYEIARGDMDQSISIFYAVTDQIEKAFLDPKITVEVPTQDKHDVNNPNLRFGDLVMHYSGGNLVHTSVFIDEGLHFEKISWRPQHPFRLGFPSSNKFPNPSFAFRRFLPSGQLPAPETIFTKETYNARTGDMTNGSAPTVMARVKYTFAPDGSATLPPDAFEPLVGKEIRYRETYSYYSAFYAQMAGLPGARKNSEVMDPSKNGTLVGIRCSRDFTPKESQLVGLSKIEMAMNVPLIQETEGTLRITTTSSKGQKREDVSSLSGSINIGQPQQPFAKFTSPDYSRIEMTRQAMDKPHRFKSSIAFGTFVFESVSCSAFRIGEQDWMTSLP